MAIEWFDTHVHLDDEAFAADRQEVLGRARHAGVVQMINAGASRQSNPRGLALAQEYPEIAAAVGLHPHEFSGQPLQPQDLDVLQQQLSQEPVVALGEIGLDFHVFPDFPAPDPKRQTEAFQHQLALAKRFELPVILHVREAYPEALRILQDLAPYPAGGVMHCYAGGTEHLAAVLNLGFSIGVGGSVTYPKSGDLRAALREIPEDRLLLETDAPYLPPQSRRGQRNEPAGVVAVAEVVSQIRGVALGQLAETTTQNARRLFRLETGPIGTLVYEIQGHLYINLTNRCSASCGFCPRRIHRRVEHHTLDLRREPSAQEIIAAIGDPGQWQSIVFCGYGEPTLRWPTLLAVARAVKSRARWVRVNTNGHGELLYGTQLLEEAQGWVDEWSVSLNSADPVQYQRLVAPAAGAEAFPAMQAFIQRAVQAGFKVTASAVAIPDVVNEAAVQALAERLGAHYRSRAYEQREAKSGH